MKIRDELLRDNSLDNTTRICRFCLSDEACFADLMSCFFSNDYRLAQRAAAVVSRVALVKPDMISPYLNQLIDQLPRKDVHDAVIRNSVRILEQVAIPEEFHGRLITFCFSLVEDTATPVAIKAFSLSVLGKLSKLYPEIKNELRVLIEDRFEFETAAYRSRAKKILAML